jgi:NAD dependent epimerase/dehydratase family
VILLSRPAHKGSQACHATAVFGSGLVGGSIIRAMQIGVGSSSSHFPLNWTTAKARRLDLAAITTALMAMPATTTFDVIWAAGRTGFACTKDDVAEELAAFTEIMDWTRSLSDSFGARLLNLHIVSSAGGLFEGRRFVGSDSLPRPQRAYGELKLDEEHIALRVSDRLPVQIYRPSSVYGLGGVKGRSGLVNTLIMNAKTHTTSRIFGGLDTIRDYVLASDIGKFIAAQTGARHGDSKTHLLASGKPAALGEVLAIIYRVVERPLLIKLDPVPSNASHITFRPSALPSGWSPTDLETGIRQVMLQLSQLYESAAHR